jgi:hypothetical protein
MNKFSCTDISNDVNLPKDTRNHCNSNIEWWYYYAFLEGDNGESYATMASFFSIGGFDFFKGHYLIFSLIDLKKNTHISYSFTDPELIINLLLRFPCDKKMWKQFMHLLRCKLPYPHKIMKNASIRYNPTRLSYANSSLDFLDETNNYFNVNIIEDDNMIDLLFFPNKSISLIGGDGKPNELFYYSFTRNAVEGYIKDKETKEIVKVKGEGWFDHQWGYTLDMPNWNWFGLQLDDGRELLIQTSKSFSSMANCIDINGDLKFTQNVILQPAKYWNSPTTGTVYPVEWNIILSDFNMNINVVPDFKEQEMFLLEPLKSIWEGTCLISIKEKLNNQEIKNIFGNGFMELVGYANNVFFET